MSDGFKFKYLKSLHGSGIPTAARVVLVTILDYADADGCDAFPGEERLAADCNMSKRTIQRHIAWLKENGWLIEEYRGRKGRGGHGWASVYSVSYPSSFGEDRTSPEYEATDVEVEPLEALSCPDALVDNANQITHDLDQFESTSTWDVTTTACRETPEAVKGTEANSRGCEASMTSAEPQGCLHCREPITGGRIVGEEGAYHMKCYIDGGYAEAYRAAHSILQHEDSVVGEKVAPADMTIASLVDTRVYCQAPCPPEHDEFLRQHGIGQFGLSPSDIEKLRRLGVPEGCKTSTDIQRLHRLGISDCETVQDLKMTATQSTSIANAFKALSTS